MPARLKFAKLLAFLVLSSLSRFSYAGLPTVMVIAWRQGDNAGRNNFAG